MSFFDIIEIRNNVQNHILNTNKVSNNSSILDLLNNKDNNILTKKKITSVSTIKEAQKIVNDLMELNKSIKLWFYKYNSLNDLEKEIFIKHSVDFRLFNPFNLVEYKIIRNNNDFDDVNLDDIVDNEAPILLNTTDFKFNEKAKNNIIQQSIENIVTTEFFNYLKSSDDTNTFYNIKNITIEVPVIEVPPDTQIKENLYLKIRKISDLSLDISDKVIDTVHNKIKFETVDDEGKDELFGNIICKSLNQIVPRINKSCIEQYKNNLQ
jgi:hypothetical protein